MSKAVYQQPAFVCLHQFGLAAPVCGTFEWIGQRLADEMVWISKHTCDWHYAQVIEVEVYTWQKYAPVPCCNQAERRCDRHSALI
jgi:hypothetical protein